MGNNQPIGILDSGVGGLTVVKEVFRQLPHEEIIYFGDSARLPYGPRPAEEIKQFTHEIVHFLLDYHVKMIVIACNTATAVALETVKKEVDIPVIGVIRPGSVAAIKNTKTGKIGVIGTDGTIKSGAYEKSLTKINPKLKIESQACPTLVPLVEEGNHSEEEIRKIVLDALKPIKKFDMDALILGCTHYPIISEYIQEVVGPHVKLLSSAEETAREMSTVLHYQCLLADNANIPSHHFFTSGNKKQFKQIAESWLGKHINVEQVDITAAKSISK